MDTLVLPLNVVIAGRVTPTYLDVPAGTVGRTNLVTDLAKPYPISIHDCFVWDAPQTPLPNPSANDDLGIYNGTFNTAPPYMGTSDLKAANSTSRYARCRRALPAEYVDGQTVKVRLTAGMITTVAGVAATIDVECYKIGGDGAMGSDLCATAAQSINSLIFADLDFTLNAAGLVAGDELDIRITVLVNDAATGTAVIGACRKIKLLCDVKG